MMGYTPSILVKIQTISFIEKSSFYQVSIMGNKFLEKYPTLWNPKIGDKVKIILVLSAQKAICADGEWSYNKNEVGIITGYGIYGEYNTYQVLFHTIPFRKEEHVFREEIELYHE
jgi:hypothetical protein